MRLAVSLLHSHGKECNFWKMVPLNCVGFYSLTESFTRTLFFLFESFTL